MLICDLEQHKCLAQLVFLILRFSDRCLEAGFFHLLTIFVSTRKPSLQGRDVAAPVMPQFLLSRPDVARSRLVGCAIVKEIDPSLGLITLITPVRPSALVAVNTLVRGSIELPPYLLIKDAPPTALYSSVDILSALGSGATGIKSRSNILRRRHEP